MASKIENGPIFDDWTEYKRLVLSELERLNQAAEKLKDQCIEIQSNIKTEISNARELFNDKLSTIDKNHPSHGQLAAVKRELDILDQKFSAYRKEQRHDSVASSKWGFWAAVVSIIGSLIASIISLIVSLSI